MNHRNFLLTLLWLPFLAFASPPDEAPAPASTAPRASSAGRPAGVAFHVLGSEDAPVAMVEFSDLQCPFCARYEQQVFPEIKRKYIDTGKVHYAVSDFPLEMHPNAIPAAIAARCAGMQGKFWEYRQAIFDDQSQLSSFGIFETVARHVGLDVAKFDACFSDTRQQAKVLQERDMARAAGVGSTPTFFIGRVVKGGWTPVTIEGAKPFDTFAATIDELLKASN